MEIYAIINVNSTTEKERFSGPNSGREVPDTIVKLRWPGGGRTISVNSDLPDEPETLKKVDSLTNLSLALG
jgi:hypothetical protein